tara:strand:+ start:2938 stop:3312 length:375 start_codon:yes stop_codon:yes gene_type:complete
MSNPNDNVPEHIGALYDAAMAGDSSKVAELFDSASSDEQDDMFSEMVAMRITVPTCGAIVHWIAEGDPSLYEVDMTEVIRGVINTVVGQLSSAVEDDSDDFIENLSNKVFQLKEEALSQQKDET